MIVQVPVKKEVHLQERFGDCRVEVPKVQIIEKIMQVPNKKEAHPQEQIGYSPRSNKGANH